MSDRSIYPGFRTRALLGLTAFALAFGGVSTGGVGPIPTVAQAADAGGGGLDSSGNCSGGDGGYGDMLMGFENKGGDQYATNPGSTATGLYQMTVAALQEAGYITSVSGKTPNGKDPWSNVTWSGKDGIYSRDQYMSNTQAQANSLAAYTAKNLSYIQDSFTAGQSVNGVTMTNGGAGAAVHMLGAGGFRAWAASGFSASGLNATRAAEHGWTQEQYQQHIMERVAAGGCFDPANIKAAASKTQDGTPVQDLPEIFLMPWENQYPPTVIFPGTI